MNLNKTSLYDIVQIIKQDWKSVYFSAKPYLEAMEHLNSINGSIGQDSGREIILYFLINSKQWKGQTAREIKLHLRELINENNER